MAKTGTALSSMSPTATSELLLPATGAATESCAIRNVAAATRKRILLI